LLAGAAIADHPHGLDLDLGVFSMYSAALAASGSDSSTASGAFRIIAASFMASP